MNQRESSCQQGQIISLVSDASQSTSTRVFLLTSASLCLIQKRRHCSASWILAWRHSQSVWFCCMKRRSWQIEMLLYSWQTVWCVSFPGGTDPGSLMLPKSELWSPRVKSTTGLWSVRLWGPFRTTPCAIHQTDGQWLGSGPNRALCRSLRGPRATCVCL